MRLPLKFLFFVFFFRNFSKESPFNFSKFCNRMGIKKSQRVPSFTVFGIVRFYKRNNFRVKISRFSPAQHAISDFCFFFNIKKDQFFFYATFLKFVSPKPLNFCRKRKVLRELRTPQGFRHYATYRRPSKIFLKKFFPHFFVFFFKGFSLRKMVFCCFQLGKNGSRDLCVSLRVFLAL